MEQTQANIEVLKENINIPTNPVDMLNKKNEDLQGNLADNATKFTSNGQEKPNNMGIGVVFYHQNEAEKLNSLGQEADMPLQYEPTPIMPPDTYEGVRYEKYRNTGVDYFDNKKNLTLLDALMAKQLGLNVSYNFHKIDMKTDNTTRNLNFTKSINNMTNTLSYLNQGLGAAVSLSSLTKGEEGKSAIKSVIGRSPIGAFIHTSEDSLPMTQETFKEVATNLLYARNDKAVTDKQRESIEQVTKNITNNGRKAYATLLPLYEKGLADVTTNYNSIKNSGLINPQMQVYYENQIKQGKAVTQYMRKIVEAKDDKEVGALEVLMLQSLSPTQGQI